MAARKKAEQQRAEAEAATAAAVAAQKRAEQAAAADKARLEAEAAAARVRAEKEAAEAKAADDAPLSLSSLVFALSFMARHALRGPAASASPLSRRRWNVAWRQKKRVRNLGFRLELKTHSLHTLLQVI